MQIKLFENYKDIVGINEMCKMLGISRPTAKKLLDGNIIFYRKIGRKYLVSKREIINYMAA